MPKNNLKGIRGWLLLYVIFISFRLLFGIFVFLVYQEINPILIIEVLLVAFALFSIFAKFHTKKINIGYLLIAVITTISAYFDDITSNVMEERAYGVGAVMGSVVISVIWIVYWINSKRVKNTFNK